MRIGTELGHLAWKKDPDDIVAELLLLGISFFRGVPEDVVEEIGEGRKGAVRCGNDIFFAKYNLAANGFPVMAAKKKATKKVAPKKAAKKTASKKGVGKRYTDEVKGKIVKFVNDHNAKNGRGGVTKAVEKFGATALSISNWVKGAGGGKAKKATKAAKAPSKGGSIYARISALANDIGVMEGKIADKKAELKKLNAQL